MAKRLRRGQDLVLASHNQGKLQEIAALLAPYAIVARSAAEYGLPEPDETAPDFAGNARLKALAAAIGTGLPALADDSGFCVAALGGAPGIFSARWAGPDRDFGAAMARVQHERGTGGTRAWFVCALSLAWPDGETATFLGRVEGDLTWPPRGTQGFGYDPMFVPHGYSETFGEMTHDRKEAISHRARAMAQFVAACVG